MNKYISIFFLLAALTLTTSCNDWLTVKPNNEQITVDYWQSKEDVEAVVASGYKFMRESVPTIIKWGELRGGSLYQTSDTKVQDFNVTPSHTLAKYETIYKAINMANSVIYYAPSVCDGDATYKESMMKSHLTEAYFQRAYCYLLLLKNFKEVPLVVKPYVDDTEAFKLPKSTETEIMDQIKKDVKDALATGAAKGTYDDILDPNGWQTKGRATKWSLYALMADACLWSEDYAGCIEYCNLILNATDTFRPAFLTNTNDWYTIFYPGNSNESIFELNWSYDINQESNNFASQVFAGASSFATLRLTDAVVEKLKAENEELVKSGYSTEGRVGRGMLATYINSGNSYYIWKYAGNDITDVTGGVRTHQDANWIVYRVAEIKLMKAQAEAMTGNFKEAVSLINDIRLRAALSYFNGIDVDDPASETLINQLTEQEVIEEILLQKQLEFIAEGKRWYDLLWLGRVAGGKYRQLFVDYVIAGNQTTNSSWVESVLMNENAWYLPIPQADIDNNDLLKQNPYYTK